MNIGSGAARVARNAVGVLRDAGEGVRSWTNNKLQRQTDTAEEPEGGLEMEPQATAKAGSEAPPATKPPSKKAPAKKAPTKKTAATKITPNPVPAKKVAATAPAPSKTPPAKKTPVAKQPANKVRTKAAAAKKGDKATRVPE
ncbi:hypothetical protein P3H15_50685 [Rhodococcus sp. T2V]|nr:hypothetical protein [Rhodococcus sp. T2V]